MNAMRIALAGMLAAVTLAAVSLTGCSKKTVDRLIPNLPPTVRLTAAPYDTSRATPYFYAYRMNWIASDPDGRIDYFLYAIDPPSSPTEPVIWTRTVRNEQIVFFTADSSSARDLLATRAHIFAICAVDNRGDTSEIVRRGFFSYTQAPSVTLANPLANIFSPIFVTPSVRIQWNGNDPDGQLTTKPVKYKYVLLGPGSTFPVDLAISNPDSLRNYYAYYWEKNGLPGPWAGWDSTSADTNFVQFQNLTPNQTYLFVVIGFDEAGAFSPVFSLAQNMLRLRPGFASTLGPKFTIFNDFFVYQYPSGGWAPQNEVKLDVPAGQSIPFFWSAEPPAGALIESYRWMLDGDPYDDTTRERESDVTHWSEPSQNITNVSVGPFAGKTEHFLYIEALDNNGLRSLGVIHMFAVQATLERDLMVVYDVRMIEETPGVPSIGCLIPPVRSSNFWPFQAELDTFLFARGNVPWQCTPGNSEPGLFAGYKFDVYRTKTTLIDKTVRLDTLGKYANIVWITDKDVGGTTGGYAMSYMSAPGRVNTLGIYARQGGKVWMAGGGAAVALCKAFDVTANNPLGAFLFSNRHLSELQPGRFMYDVAHWRSEIMLSTPSNALLKRSVRADTIMARGGWTMPTWGGVVKSNPNYYLLPAALEHKSTGTEPLPATRSLIPSTFFRPTPSATVEYLHQPNFVLEDIDNDPVTVTERPTLDTLLKSEAVLTQNYIAYEVGGIDPLTQRVRPGSVRGTPIMTYYHGRDFPAFVFSGHDLWNYRRDQLTQLVDFVLGQIFGLTKTGPLPAPARISRATPKAWSPGTGAARAADDARRVVPVATTASSPSTGSPE